MYLWGGSVKGLPRGGFCDGGAMKEHPPVSQQVGGTHSTGMHSFISFENGLLLCRMKSPRSPVNLNAVSSSEDV